MCLLHYIGGAFTHQPEELRAGLSSTAADLIKRAFADVDPKCMNPEIFVDTNVFLYALSGGPEEQPKAELLRERFQVSYWDAAIIAASHELGCATILLREPQPRTGVRRH
jgi:predicted nucleic acid-binding protein